MYLATQNRPGGLARRVAVKVLKVDLEEDGQAVLRLSDEGRMLAALQHPCILAVRELTRIDGRLALVTEYVEGIDISVCTRPDSLLPSRAVVGIVGELAGALDCAWNTLSPETGQPLHLVHRDIKPENVRLSRHGEVKLLDFGIARTTQLYRNADTAVGDMPFTPGYAAPESYTKGEQTERSDIYALGVTLYRLLVGERLFQGIALQQQFQVTASAERYEPFILERLERISAASDVKDLLRDLLAYEAPSRPTAAEVQARCDRIADTIPGPTHARWARAQHHHGPRNVGGSLVGRTVNEDEANRVQLDSRDLFEDLGTPLPAHPNAAPSPKATGVTATALGQAALFFVAIALLAGAVVTLAVVMLALVLA